MSERPGSLEISEILVFWHIEGNVFAVIHSLGRDASLVDRETLVSLIKQLSGKEGTS